MMKVPKEADDVGRKQELLDSSSNRNNYEKAKAAAAAAAASSLEQEWVRLKDPRIVRVARSCGGKDRHSKVCTIRGLRDRRVRLSVPTAIQLYDLQERLGFNQPSKVIDWLLDAAKNDIDQLPPLPPLNLALLHHPLLTSTNNNSSHHHQPNQEEEEEEASDRQLEASRNNTTFWKLIEPKEAPDDDVKQGRNDDQLLSHHHHPSFVGYHQWEGSVSGGGGGHHHHVSHQTDLQSMINVVPFSSTLSLSTGDSSHHHFASQHFGASMEMDHIHNNNNHYPMLMSSSSDLLYPISVAQSLKPFGLSMMTPNNNTSDQSHHQSHIQNLPTK